MKILESQSAVLTNFEVYQHLQNVQYEFAQPDRRRKVPRSVQNIVKELMEYFRTSPNPFAQNPITYNGFTIQRLVEKLSPYDLSKGETIMILNVRPENLAVLSTCIENVYERFTEDQQNEIQAIIEDVLGPFPPKEYAAEGDEEMGA
ncbi:hypothetical protein N0V82_002491 [Gnomoniopsis sp. IMI 355080]|nr:hypothetical protein N0V82_002491 [Gnomoniopsis sp. IMI 355080]